MSNGARTTTVVLLALPLLVGCAHSIPDVRTMKPEERLWWLRRIVVEDGRRFSKMVLSQQMSPVFKLKTAVWYRVHPIEIGPPSVVRAPIPQAAPDFGPAPSFQQLWGLFVVLPGRTALSSKLAERVARILVDPRSYTTAASGCFFEPVMVVRFEDTGKTLDFYFDAECQDVALVSNGTQIVWHGILADDAKAKLRSVADAIVENREITEPAPEEQ